MSRPDTPTLRKRRPPPRHADPRKARALRAYVALGTVTHACRRVEIHRDTWYEWINADPEFARAAADAREEVIDGLAKEAIRRAKKGSDKLLIFLLKALSHEYRDRREQEPRGIPVAEFEEFLHELAAAVDRGVRTTAADTALVVTILESIGREWLALLAARYPDVAATVRPDRDEPAPIERRLPAGE